MVEVIVVVIVVAAVGVVRLIELWLPVEVLGPPIKALYPIMLVSY